MINLSHAAQQEVQLARPSTAGLGIAEPTARWEDPFVRHERPATLVLDLTNNAPLAAALENIVVRVARRTESGEYGPARLIICTSDRGLQNILRGLAVVHHLSFFIATSPAALHAAQPAAPVTPTEMQSLDVVQQLGGVASSSAFAQTAGIDLKAAGNRLVNLEREGYLQRIRRPGREGDIYLDPRVVALDIQ